MRHSPQPSKEWSLRESRCGSTGTFITTWGADGSGNGQFNLPTRIAVDGSGNVYVADYGNHRVQVFTNSGAYVTQWGSFGNGPGQFSGNIGIAVDGSGYVYVADTNNQRIQKFGPLPTPTTATSWGQLKRMYQ